ncbi:SseB family protein [uncultured Microbacterium sp.]|uniref:SseB family protein n=1 Tax=uncultured Microbacterium sp. TaxID=191216 RepID=UPI0025D8EEAE|nr:SseB family protein [uncultured Microbacterium sp.]
MLFPKDDHSMMAVFTSPQEAERVAHLAPFVVAMSGSQLLLHCPATQDLVVNPGSNLGFDIEPAGIAKFRTERVP